MRFYFCIAGIGSILYYLLLVIYTGKWNSTFSRFWMVCGGAHLLLFPVFSTLPSSVQLFLEIAAAVCWGIVLLAGGRILSAAKQSCGCEAAFVIILGAQVRGTRITRSLQQRLDKGAAYLRRHSDTKAIVSGGQGKGEAVTEAYAMAEYLVQCGIGRERIFLEERSTSTWENLCFSAQYVTDQDAPAAVVTNDFHLYRALLLGRKAGYTNLHGIAAASNRVLFFNYLMREIFAVILTRVREML